MLRSFILCFLLGAYSLSHGQILTLEQAGRYSLSPYVAYFQESQQHMDIESIVKNHSSIQWIENTQPNLNFGFSNKTYWLHIQLKSNDESAQQWALEVAYSQLDYVDAYIVNAQGKVTQHHRGGDKVSINERSVQYPNTVFPVNVGPQKQDIYLRINSQGSSQIPLFLWQWKELNYNTLKHYFAQGLFYGVMLLMAFYNLSLWFTKKESVYINYAFYIFCFVLFEVSLTGMGFQFLWPNHPWINTAIVPISIGLLLSSLYSFIRSFFNTKANHLKLDNVLKINAYLLIFLSFIAVFIPYIISINIMATSAVFTASLVIYITFYMVKRRHPSVRYFILAWSSFLFASMLLAGSKFGVFEATVFSEYGLQIGAILEVIFLSMALADRIASIQKDKVKAQEKLIVLATQVQYEKDKVYEMERKSLKIEKANNIRLELEVSERTSELKITIDRLSLAYEKLQTISITDALTGIHNRHYFNEHWRIEHKRAYREKTDLTIIILDVDHFKKVNDTYGHPAGDKCLKEVANCICAHAAREQDICCRYGGEEFAIILPGTNEEGALLVAQSIRQAIEDAKVSWQGEYIKLTASMGISSLVPNNESFEKKQLMIHQADQALYQAKSGGRNKVMVYSDE